jgi:thiamine-phosphate pyrophosphorylase
MSKRKSAISRPAPRLYLVTPEVRDALKFGRELAAALAATDVAAVLLRLEAADAHALIDRIKALAPIVQSTDTALVLDGHPDIVSRGGADGAHLTGIEVFAAAVGGLKPDHIAGCGGLHTRHDAMLAGERGADYVLFGEPEGDGMRPSFAAVVERVEWWAEVFEIPCVGYAASRDEIASLVKAGADFVAVDYVWADAGGIGAAVADASRQLARHEEVA